MCSVSKTALEEHAWKHQTEAIAQRCFLKMPLRKISPQKLPLHSAGYQGPYQTSTEAATGVAV